MTDSPITVVLADGQALLRAGFAMVIESQPDMEVVAQVGDGSQQQQKLDRLTNREREILTEMASGESNTEIAGRLYLSEATVKTHVG